MPDPISVLWTPAGINLPSLGARALVDVSDGDTPNIRMPIRMLSIDTPEVTARTSNGAARWDERFERLVGWLKDGTAPVSARYRDYILPKLEGRNAGTFHFQEGEAASSFFKARSDERLRRPSGRRRNLFVRTADETFDSFGRILAYVSPSYSERERRDMTRRERATFNLDLIESGHAAPFIIYPSIPGELDLPLFVEIADDAMANKRGQYADPLHLPGYEYRMMERLFRISERISGGSNLSFSDRIAWRERYAFDLRDRVLYGPESYMNVPPPYRGWIFPDDVQDAISRLNLSPDPMLVA